MCQLSATACRGKQRLSGNKKETAQKQQSNINRIFTRANQNWSFSDVTKRNLNKRNESTQSLDTNNLLLQIIQLFNKVLMPKIF
jgi:hypothetical protein